MEVYLDHAATTSMRPEAVAAMVPLLDELVGNPSGSHRVARAARRTLDDARDAFADTLGCEPGEIVFTSGGTESDNIAVLGSGASGRAVVTSAIEHPAVLAPVTELDGRIVGVDRNGSVDLDELEGSLDPDVELVSIMAANNEIGSIQPIADVAQLVGERAPHAILHTDAVQAAPWLDLTEIASCVDQLSLSSHKFGGPKGVGVLMVRKSLPPSPRQIGGGQERGWRSGTQNVAGIAGAAAAISATKRDLRTGPAQAARQRDCLLAGLTEVVGGLRPTIDERTASLPNICHVMVEGVESESVLFALEQHDIFASAASSCSSGAAQGSHVLEALGDLPEDAASLRLSVGHSTRDDEIDRALEVIPEVIAKLRAATGGVS